MHTTVDRELETVFTRDMTKTETPKIAALEPHPFKVGYTKFFVEAGEQYGEQFCKTCGVSIVEHKTNEFGFVEGVY